MCWYYNLACQLYYSKGGQLFCLAIKILIFFVCHSLLQINQKNYFTYIFFSYIKVKWLLLFNKQYFFYFHLLFYFHLFYFRFKVNRYKP